MRVKIDPKNPLNVQNRNNMGIAVCTVLVGEVGLLCFQTSLFDEIISKKTEESRQRFYNTKYLWTEGVKKEIREMNKNERLYAKIFAVIWALLMFTGACICFWWIKNMTVGIMISSLYGIALLFSVANIPAVEKCEKITFIKTEIKAIKTDDDGGELEEISFSNGIVWKARKGKLVGFTGIVWSSYIELKCTDVPVYIAIDEKRRIQRIFHGKKYVLDTCY